MEKLPWGKSCLCQVWKVFGENVSGVKGVWCKSSRCFL